MAKGNQVDTDLMDLECMSRSRSGLAHGYKLLNEVYVVWQGTKMQSNTSTLEKMLARFPNVAILPTRLFGQMKPETAPVVYKDGIQNT